MSYSAYETGAYTGEPVELYEFNYGSQFWYYTSDASDFTVNSITYTAIPINRGAVELTPEIARKSPKIEIDSAALVLNMFRGGMPADFVTVKISRVHRADPESIVVWLGRVVTVTWNGASASLNCESVFTSIRRSGLRRLYQKQCPHVLYSAACGLSSATYKAVKAVLGISGTLITLDNLVEAAGYFVGGFMEWEAPGGVVERRAIGAQGSGNVTVTFPIIGLTAGQNVSIYPGCDHTLAVCASKFANSDNYGGMPYIPQKNPFGGTAVY